MRTNDVNSLLFIVGLMLVDHVIRASERLAECRAIEQVTYDREFWELVNADGRSRDH